MAKTSEWSVDFLINASMSDRAVLLDLPKQWIGEVGFKRQVVTLYDEISEESSERLWSKTVQAIVMPPHKSCFIYSYSYFVFLIPHLTHYNKMCLKQFYCGIILILMTNYVFLDGQEWLPVCRLTSAVCEGKKRVLEVGGRVAASTEARLLQNQSYIIVASTASCHFRNKHLTAHSKCVHTRIYTTPDGVLSHTTIHKEVIQ